MREHSVKIDDSVYKLISELKFFLEKRQPLSKYSRKKIMRLAVLQLIKKVKSDYNIE